LKTFPARAAGKVFVMMAPMVAWAGADGGLGAAAVRIAW
jgi:hypothetical protein